MSKIDKFEGNPEDVYGDIPNRGSMGPIDRKSSPFRYLSQLSQLSQVYNLSGSDQKPFISSEQTAFSAEPTGGKPQGRIPAGGPELLDVHIDRM